MSEYDMLYQELRQAQQNFDYADKDHVYQATLDLIEAEMKYDQYMNERGREVERNIQECSK